MSIIGEDFGVVVEHGRNEMDAVSGAQKHRCRQGNEDLGSGLDCLSVKRVPGPIAPDVVLQELLDGSLENLGTPFCFTQTPVENRHQFNAHKFRYAHHIFFLDPLPHVRSFELLNVELCESRGVTKNHRSPRIASRYARTSLPGDIVMYLA